MAGRRIRNNAPAVMNRLYVAESAPTITGASADHRLALKSSEIEGEKLDAEQVRSSVARRLGLDIGGLKPADRNVEGVVEMMLDATHNYRALLTEERLFGWHAALFPAG